MSRQSRTDVQWIGLSTRIEEECANMFFSVKSELKIFEYHGADFVMGIDAVFESGSCGC